VQVLIPGARALILARRRLLGTRCQIHRQLHWFDLKPEVALRRTSILAASWVTMAPGRSLGQIRSPAPIALGVNGWELGGIFELSDGVPFTPLFGAGGDPLGLNQ